MGKIYQNWAQQDFSNAVICAVKQNASPKLINHNKEKLLFNGFWRKGEHQNVCLWLDKATWHDAKTGDGGGCKEFAKIAFNMTLPEFMERFGAPSVQIGELVPIKEIFEASQKLNKPVNEIWAALQKHDQKRPDRAGEWLSNKRGFDSPRFNIGSGFVNLGIEDTELFEPQHHKLIKHRLDLGPQLVAPLRGVNSDHVQNLFIRSISECSKEEKSRLLTGAGGWHEPDGTPRAFGFPHLIHDFPNLVLCEGMADYFAAECLLEDDEKFLPIGAASASALPKWAEWLIKTKYQGRIYLVYQLDSNTDGELSTKEIGPAKAIQAIKTLKENNIKASLFDWLSYVRNITTHPEEINDLADSLKAEATYKECGPTHLNFCFKHIGLRAKNGDLNE